MTRWWQEKPMRLIQTNLREIDAALDVGELVDSLQQYSANVLLFNAGGIVANYETKLPFHYKNPNLRNDFLGEVVEAAHRAGIKLIARFDFSRLNEQIALQHPEWLYKSVKGDIVNYNGQVHTCLNGAYQQERSIDILRECAGNYPIDGVFINMHGYVTSDYSYNYHGICQCGNCRDRFRQMFGHERLPIVEDGNDPVFRDYQKFREETVAELFVRRSQAVKRINENIAICNYTPEGTDIFRKESNTGIDRPLPEFNYASSYHVKTVHGSWPGMAVSNSAVHFVDFAMRHSAVSPHLTAVRLAEDLVQGGWLDFYVIGTLTNQDDRLVLDSVKELYRFHAEHEEQYRGIEAVADLCLVEPHRSAMFGSIKEFRGLFRILSERHLLFDVVQDSVLEGERALETLRKYKAVVLPDVRAMSPEAVSALDNYVRSGGKLLATGFSSTCDRKGNPLDRFQLESLGVAGIQARRPRSQGDYFAFLPGDKERLNGFESVDVVYLSGEMLCCEPKATSTAYLGLIDQCMFGPPEKCYYTEVSSVPGVIRQGFGKGGTVAIPWGVGAHYERLSNHGHSLLVASALRDLLQLESSIEVEASPLLEVSAHRGRDGTRDLVHVVNHSGQLGTAFHAPLPVRNVACTFAAARKPTGVRALRSAADLPFTWSDDRVSFTIPEVRLFETVVIRY
ncbi:alpha-amylase family protein [Paenibacillus sp.]|uniref:alpha-amylase family protein n=1 Tax=Paenibacillus sp. TaxID=58172 RepID=UPI002D3EA579|nr:alpha-amylase family protein [Paenibacillus sp.]HZG86718.1 alpha-amylase family protein [Paenibacillus sp.]